ncbi:MAG: o-succinylbenzoate synthase [Flavobacteriaceae bacterium]|nr:o-succinylbenzoate synthase [Flavobacteriaceae bacterium]
MKAHYKRYMMKFKVPGGTSRGVLTEKETWFLFLESGEKIGVGECGLFRGLSHDDSPDFEIYLRTFCDRINQKDEIDKTFLKSFPSIQIGYEMASLSLKSEDSFTIFPSAFTGGKETIPINGLIWMGDKHHMNSQIQEKIGQGFDCLKLKIGVLHFEEELTLIKDIRTIYGADQLMIRVDANGAFKPSEALSRLKSLANLDIHSIEQPIAAGNHEALYELCERTPLPIALDEELIGVVEKKKKADLLDNIAPQYLILKPSLLGGFKACEEWISLAEERSIDWWVTSALESNIGLNAIAQWTFSLNFNGHQGLGTGGLFTNNFNCPLEVRKGHLTFNTNHKWEAPFI